MHASIHFMHMHYWLCRHSAYIALLLMEHTYTLRPPPKKKEEKKEEKKRDKRTKTRGKWVKATGPHEPLPRPKSRLASLSGSPTSTSSPTQTIPTGPHQRPPPSPILQERPILLISPVKPHFPCPPCTAVEAWKRRMRN